MSDFDAFMKFVADNDVENVLLTFQPDYLSMEKDLSTPLHMACKSGHIELVIILCSALNIEDGDNYNYRAIHLACMHGHLEVVKYLYEQGCNIEAPGNFGNRPLHVACEYGRLNIVKYLCEKQCIIDASNSDHWKPIHFACKGGHADIVKFLCSQACDKEAVTNHGERPLHVACKYGHHEVVKLLVVNDCDIEVSTSTNYRPLHLACKHGHLEIVRRLCEYGCNLEAFSMFNCRPIHLAVLNGHLEVVRYLCLKQCEIEVSTKMSQSVLDLAIQKQQHGILDILCDEITRRKLIQKILKIKTTCDEVCDHSFCFKSITAARANNDGLLGRGSFGSVYKIKDPKLNFTFCVKYIFINPNGVNQKPKHIEYNINKFLHILYHERIVQYFRTLNTDDEMFIFMDYIEGIPLNKRIRESKSLPHGIVIRYSKEVLEGLRFLHKNKVIHRDIKSQNIMITADDHVKLCDFGLSCYMESIGVKTSNMTICGTANYMAPECINGEEYSYPVDIWGLGATFVEMVTGHPPYYGLHNFAVIFKIGNTKTIECNPVEPLSGNMKSFLEHMLCPDPLKRATAGMLLQFISCMF